MQKIKAALLILLGSFFSCTDDVIQRILAEHGYTPWQIVQGRTFLVILILLPFVIKKNFIKPTSQDCISYVGGCSAARYASMF